jgi:hypothetical protein
VASERTIRTPKRPLAYAFMAAAAAMILAACVVTTWRIAHATPEAPMQMGAK